MKAALEMSLLSREWCLLTRMKRRIVSGLTGALLALAFTTTLPACGQLYAEGSDLGTADAGGVDSGTKDGSNDSEPCSWDSSDWDQCTWQ